MTVIEQVVLTFVEGSSDKEYRIQLAAEDKVYMVKVQWGRRGSTLQSGEKYKGEDIETAKKVYSKIHGEKVGKGYRVESGDTSEVGVGYVGAAGGTSEAVKLGVVPQLLNVIEDTEVESYLRDTAYGLQEKMDGKHLMIEVCNGVMRCFNKKGIEVGYPSEWTKLTTNTLKGLLNILLDGEGIGDKFYCFDMLSVSGVDLRGDSYQDRYGRLSGLLSFKSEVFKVVPLAIGYKAKRELYDRLVSGKREGVVFKRLDAVYTAGKGHGDMWKLKFYSTASVRVMVGRDGKHSVGMAVLDGRRWVSVGNCTIPPSVKVLPGIGSVIEVRYLYAYRGGSLYQPTYIGPRDDVDAMECVIGQLKYKSSEQED